MKPWNKLWRKESARFKSMPLSARAMASYVLKFVDEGGALPLGKRDPVTAVALAVGAIPSERRWLRPAVEALVEHGYFAPQDGLLVIGNFPRYQEESAPIGRRSPNTNPTLTERSSDVGATLAEQTNDTSATNGRREISVSGGNDSLARPVLLEISEEIEKIEGEKSARTKPLSFDEKISMMEIETLFSKLRAEQGKGTWKRSGTRGYDVLQGQVDWANDPAQGATKAERLRATHEAILGWLACDSPKVVEARWPLTWLNDPGAMRANYLAARKGATVEAAPVLATDPVSVTRARLSAAQSRAERSEGTDDQPAAYEELRAARTAVREAERGLS